MVFPVDFSTFVWDWKSYNRIKTNKLRVTINNPISVQDLGTPVFADVHTVTNNDSKNHPSKQKKVENIYRTSWEDHKKQLWRKKTRKLPAKRWGDINITIQKQYQ